MQIYANKWYKSGSTYVLQYHETILLIKFPTLIDLKSEINIVLMTNN